MISSHPAGPHAAKGERWDRQMKQGMIDGDASRGGAFENGLLNERIAQNR